ncbi:MAG: hypothetical protein ACLQLG_10135 [Thermoguttaceae bacterium]
MRLTLRTMLAYLDGILEADDAQDIAKKIEDSQYATSLLHRIRDVMRRLRLAAPSISERGPGLDANTVAEYLDNTLPPDRVPDFEKVCLESDIHLAEVAACHQVLAAVLGEPVEIDPESRQRMYQLPQAAAQATAASREEAGGSSGDGAAVGDAALHQVRPRPMVPEYLREPPRKRSFLVTAALLLLAGCVVGALLLAFGFFDRWNPARSTASNPAKQSRTDKGPDKATTAPEKTSHAAGEGTSAKGKEAAKAPAAADARQKPTAPSAEKPGNPPASAAKGGAVPTPEPGKNGKQPPAAPDKGEAPAPGTGAIARSVSKPPVGPAGEELVPATPEGAEPEKEAPPPAAAERIGHYVSQEQVLLQRDAKTHEWMRVLPGEPAMTTQCLLSMPNYRPEIVLDAGITVQLVGGTQVQVLPGDLQAPPALEIVFGRVVLQPVAQGGRQVQLTFGGRSGVLTLVDSGSITAVEVTFYHIPGNNPETAAPRMVAELYVGHGAVRWQDKNQQEPLRIMAPARVVLGGPAPPEAQPLENKDLPKWIEPEPLRDLDQRGRIVLAQSLQVGRPAESGLKELAGHRRSEVARLARRCLGCLGDFEPAVAALNDSDQRQSWYEPTTGCVEQLREAIARGPKTATAVREAMERRFSPEDAAALYRMLWGYTNKDLEDGADRKLVQYLDHEKLAFRVLAFWNLKDITGMKLYYQPEQTAAQRRRWVTEWKRYREQGKVRIRGGEEKPRGSQEKPRSSQEKLRGSEAPPVSPTPPPTETNGGNHNETGKGSLPPPPPPAEP